MRHRIITIGNALYRPDSAGALVHSLLKQRVLPADTELIDGGLAGLHLLPCLEAADQIVFIDSVSGFLAEGEVAVIPWWQAETTPTYGHSGGLAYLLQMAPKVLDLPLPLIEMVGIEGEPTLPRAELAADLSLLLIARYRAQAVPAPGSRKMVEGRI